MQLPLNLPQSIRINTNIQTVVRQSVTNITSNPACRFNFFFASPFFCSLFSRSPASDKSQKTTDTSDAFLLNYKMPVISMD